MAHKYNPGGIRKGFDLLIEITDRLIQKHEDIHVHIIENWAGEMTHRKPSSQVHCHGVLPAESLPELFAKMDIFLSPNRTFKSLKKLYPPNTALEFDGFPLGNDAALCSVALFLTDELGLHKERYSDGRDIVIIKPEPCDIVDRIEYYYQNTDKLYKIAGHGRIQTEKLLNYDIQIKKTAKRTGEIL